MVNQGLFGKTGIKQCVIQEIIHLAQKYDVQKVILFGSRARGDYKLKSDIDLAFQGIIFPLMWMKKRLHCFNLIS